MELSYTKDKFNVISKDTIASKWYNSFDKEPTQVGWKIAFHKNFYEPNRWALFLYRTVESFSLEMTTFDLTLTVSEIFGRTIVEKSFRDLKFHKTGRSYKMKRYFLRWFCKDELNLLRNDKLTLKVNIRKLKVVRENSETLAETEFSADQDVKYSLIFDDLFPKEDETSKRQIESTFINLVSNDGQKFACNKKILSLKSDVFKTLLSDNDNSRQCARFQEIERNLIKIDDVDGETLREILRYIYFNVVDQNIMDADPNLPFKCLLAADKYMLDQNFKDICQDFLVLSVDDENAFDYFRLAENLNAEQLELSVGDYIFQYMPD